MDKYSKEYDEFFDQMRRFVLETFHDEMLNRSGDSWLDKAVLKSLEDGVKTGFENETVKQSMHAAVTTSFNDDDTKKALKESLSQVTAPVLKTAIDAQLQSFDELGPLLQAAINQKLEDFSPIMIELKTAKKEVANLKKTLEDEKAALEEKRQQQKAEYEEEVKNGNLRVSLIQKFGNAISVNEEVFKYQEKELGNIITKLKGLEAYRVVEDAERPGFFGRLFKSRPSTLTISDPQALIEQSQNKPAEHHIAGALDSWMEDEKQESLQEKVNPANRETAQTPRSKLRSFFSGLGVLASMLSFMALGAFAWEADLKERTGWAKSDGKTQAETPEKPGEKSNSDATPPMSSSTAAGQAAKTLVEMRGSGSVELERVLSGWKNLKKDPSVMKVLSSNLISTEIETCRNPSYQNLSLCELHSTVNKARAITNNQTKNALEGLVQSGMAIKVQTLKSPTDQSCITLSAVNISIDYQIFGDLDTLKALHRCLPPDLNQANGPHCALKDSVITCDFYDKVIEGITLYSPDPSTPPTTLPEPNTHQKQMEQYFVWMLWVFGDET